MSEDEFRRLVKESWTKAVSITSSNIILFKESLLNALQSKDGDVRSAAVASLYEANSEDAHVQVIRLLNDQEPSVRREVAEYLTEYGVSKDIETIYSGLTLYPEIGFQLSSALRTITGRDSGVVDDDDSVEVRNSKISEWHSFLVARDLMQRQHNQAL